MLWHGLVKTNLCRSTETENNWKIASFLGTQFLSVKEFKIISESFAKKKKNVEPIEELSKLFKLPNETKLQMAEKTSSNLESEKEELEKRINLLRESTKTSSDEVKRLSGTLNLKDVEVEALRGDLASLSDQVIRQAIVTVLNTE